MASLGGERRPTMKTIAAIGTACLLAVTPVFAQSPAPGAEQQVMRDINLSEAQARIELAQLSPALRSEVLQRATGGNTVRGVLETMLLNNVSQVFASGRVVAVDFIRGAVVVEGPNNQVRAFPFNVATLQLRS
jgi:hypothetical protein